MASFRVKRELFAVVALLLAGRLPAAEVNEELRARFLKGVRNEVNRYDDLDVRIRGVLTTQFSPATIARDFSGEKVGSLRKRGMVDNKLVVTGEIAVRGNSVLNISTTARGVTVIEGTNPEYFFAISRQGEVGNYTLQALEKHGESQAMDERRSRRVKKVLITVPGIWTVLGEPLSSWVNSSGFELTGIKEVDYEGEKLVRVDFVHRTEKVIGMLYRVDNAYLVCDPGRRWAVRECAADVLSVSGKLSNKQWEKRELLGLPNGFPIVSTFTRTTEWIESPGNIDKSVQTAEVLASDVPEEVFRLSHYGLPEPNFGGRWFGPWVWYLIGGIGCIVVGVLIRRKFGR